MYMFVDLVEGWLWRWKWFEKHLGQKIIYWFIYYINYAMGLYITYWGMTILIDWF